MKKFIFKLEALLKLREFEEQKAIVELGRIVKSMQDLKNENSVLSEQIGECYRMQELEAKNKTTGRQMSFYPQFITAKRAHIKKNETLIIQFLKKYEAAKIVMQQRRADLKLVVKMKEKEFIEYKKENEKKMYQEIEDSYQRMRFQKIKNGESEQIDGEGNL
jgi:flagellar FliJ protein